MKVLICGPQCHWCKLTEYEQQHDLFPMIQLMFGDLKFKHSKEIAQISIHVSKSSNRSHVFFLHILTRPLTSFVAHSISLTIITAHQLMNLIDDIWPDWCLKHGWQCNRFVFDCLIFLGVNTHEWA